MASESSLLQRWHPAYQPSASGIPLKMIGIRPRTKKGFYTLMSFLAVSQSILLVRRDHCVGD